MKLDIQYDDRERSWCVKLLDGEARAAAERANRPYQTLDGVGVVYTRDPDNRDEAVQIADEIRANVVPIPDPGG